MQFLDLFEFDPLFFHNGQPKAYKYWKSVYDQATVHTTRRLTGDVNPILDAIRPNESEQVKEYRVNNERQITKAAFDLFVSKTARIIKDAEVKVEELSEVTRQFLDSKPFEYLGQSLSLQEYALECLLLTALGRSPNELLVVFPENTLFPGIPPNNLPEDGGLPENVAVTPIPKLIHFEDITYFDNDIFVFIGGQRLVEKGKDKVYINYYYAADESYWYILEPRFDAVRDKGQTNYILTFDVVVWYEHNTGSSLVNFLFGQKRTNKEGDVVYQESFLSGYFDHADEAMAAYSDNQAVRVRFAYPIVGYEETDCWHEGCVGGYINGNRNHVCPTCKGKGKVHWPGPYGNYVKKSGGGLLNDNKSTSGDPVEFYHPEVAILSESYKTWKDLLKTAKQSIGLDLLDGSGVESGQAKDLRLQDLKDLLYRIATAMYNGTIYKMLYQIESLLVVNPDDRRKPRIVLPSSFDIPTDEDLRINAENAIPEDRIHSRLVYYRNKYQNDEQIVRLYEIALCYSPIMTLELEEIRLRMAKDICKPEDLIKRDNVVIALKSLVQDNKIDLTTVSNKEAFDLIDNYLVQNGLIRPKIQEVELIDSDLEERSKLLDTVGGVTGIIQISQAVSAGTMTEVAAENLLVEVYGFNRRTAATLIDVPIIADEANTGNE